MNCCTLVYDMLQGFLDYLFKHLRERISFEAKPSGWSVKPPCRASTPCPGRQGWPWPQGSFTYNQVFLGAQNCPEMIVDGPASQLCFSEGSYLAPGGFMCLLANCLQALVISQFKSLGSRSPNSPHCTS